MSDEYVGGRPVVVVCEDGVRWSAAWRRSDDVSALVTVQSPMELRRRMEEAPASVAVVELSLRSAPAWIDWFADRACGAEKSFVVVVGDADLRTIRWQLMELGALAVVTTERQLPPVCRAALRHLGRWRPREMSYREQVWESLPW